tara:strand:+ start:728 stop:1174 length:447 start_codon:yes stop_codon:yes gene_type:complete
MALTKVKAGVMGASSVGRASIVDGDIITSKIADNAVTTAKIADDAITAAKIADAVQLGAYTSWAIKTSTYTAAHKDQLIANSGSAFTITLPSSPSAGNTVIICNAGVGTVTVGRNSSNINSAAEDGSLPQGNSVQLVYVDNTIGWFEI